MAGTTGPVRYRTGSAGAASTQTSLTVSLPSGLEYGDLLLLVLGFSGGSNVTLTPPNGWELVHRTNDGTTAGIALYRHRYTAASAGSAAFSFTSSNIVYALIAYGGVDQITAVDQVSGQANGASTSCTAPTVTTTASYVGLLHIGLGETGAVTSTPPSGYTERLDQAGTALALAVSDTVQTLIGASGTKVATLSSAVANIGVNLALFASQINSYTAIWDEGHWEYTGWGNRFATTLSRNAWLDAVAQRANARLRGEVSATIYASRVTAAPWSELLRGMEQDLAQIYILSAALVVGRSASEATLRLPPPEQCLRCIEERRRSYALDLALVRASRVDPPGCYFAAEETTPLIRDLYSHVDGITEGHDDATDNN